MNAIAVPILWRKPFMSLVVLFVASAAAAFSEEMPPPEFRAENEELRAMLIEASENNPRLQSRFEEWLAAMERFPQATSLEDPMLTYKQFIRADMSQFNVMLEQEFPWFGTLKLRGEQATKAAEAAWARLLAARNEVLLNAKRAYLSHAFLFDQVKVVEEQIDVVAYAEQLAMSKYELGLSNQGEVLRIQQQRAQFEDMRTQMLQMLEPARAELNEALGRPIGADLPSPQPLADPPAPPAAPLLTAWIRAANPLLQAANSDIEGLETGVSLAERKKYPNFRIGLEYMAGRDPGREAEDPLMPGRIMAARNLAGAATGMMPLDAGTAIDAYELFRYKEPMGDEDNAVAVSVGVNLPIWRKRIRAEIQEAEHMVRASKLDKEAMARELDREARMALFNMQDAQRRRSLYANDLVPKAQQAFATLQSGYASGSTMVTFLDIVESVQSLLEFQLEGVRSLRDWHLAAAQLEFLIGGPWDEEETQATPVEVEVTPLPFETNEAAPASP